MVVHCCRKVQLAFRGEGNTMMNTLYSEDYDITSGSYVDWMDSTSLSYGSVNKEAYLGGEGNKVTCRINGNNVDLKSHIWKNNGCSIQ